MYVGAPLVANPQAPVLMKPGDCALDHPALAGEARAMRVAGPCDPDPAPAKLLTGLARVVGATAIDLPRSSPQPAAPAAHRWHGVHGDTKRLTSLTLPCRRSRRPAGCKGLLGTKAHSPTPDEGSCARWGVLRLPRRPCSYSLTRAIVKPS